MAHILKHENKILQTIKCKLDLLQKYNQLFVLYLEPQLAKHCQVVRFEKNCLFVIVENGHWTTQLRFAIPELMGKLHQHEGLERLTGIICKTRPNVMGGARKRRRKITRLSVKTAETVLETARSIQDVRLRGIFERIAGYVEEEIVEN